MVITPERFCEAFPPERIIGTECEYDVQLRPPKNGEDADEVTVGWLLENDFLAKAFEEEPYDIQWTDGDFETFLSNGAKVYPDVRFLEYCTPESYGPIDAAASDMAGRIIVARLVEASKGLATASYRRTGYPNGPTVEAIKELLVDGATQTSSGYHENYQVPTSSLLALKSNTMFTSFLATKLWSWSGMVSHDGYVLSQKAMNVKTGIHSGRDQYQLMNGKKPMACIRSCPTENNIYIPRERIRDSWSRLEVRFADASSSPLLRFTNFGVTSLVLRLFEQEAINPKRVKAMSFKDPIAVLHQTASDVTMSHKFESVSGKRLTALEFQEHIIESAFEFGDVLGFPESELDAGIIALEAIEKLRRCNPKEMDFEPAAAWVDWAAKLNFLTKKRGLTDLHASNPEAVFRDMLWDRFSPRGYADVWWGAKNPYPTIVPQSLIYKRITTPSHKTRAIRRSAYIKAGKVSSASWELVKLNDAEGTTLRMFDPYNS